MLRLVRLLVAVACAVHGAAQQTTVLLGGEEEFGPNDWLEIAVPEVGPDITFSACLFQASGNVGYVFVNTFPGVNTRCFSVMVDPPSSKIRLVAAATEQVQLVKVFDSLGSYAPESWHAISVTLNSTHAALFVDGVATDHAALDFAVSTCADGEGFLGRDRPGLINFAGRMREVQLHAAVLQELAIAELATVCTTGGCDQQRVADGRCDGDLNSAECEYDGGDCCQSTCVAPAGTSCGPFDCRDPAAPAASPSLTPSPTPSPRPPSPSSTPGAGGSGTALAEVCVLAYSQALCQGSHTTECSDVEGECATLATAELTSQCPVFSEFGACCDDGAGRGSSFVFSCAPKGTDGGEDGGGGFAVGDLVKGNNVYWLIVGLLALVIAAIVASSKRKGKGGNKTKNKKKSKEQKGRGKTGRPSDSKRSSNNGLFGLPVEQVVANQDDQDLIVPEVVVRCVAFLREQAADFEGLFLVAGDDVVVDSYVERWNRGRPVVIKPDEAPENVAALLLRFVHDLPEPLFTNRGAQALSQINIDLDVHSVISAIRAVLVSLPDINYETLRTLVHYLSDVARHEERHRMTPENLAAKTFPGLERIGALIVRYFYDVFNADRSESPENTEHGKHEDAGDLESVPSSAFASRNLHDHQSRLQEARLRQNGDTPWNYLPPVATEGEKQGESESLYPNDGAHVGAVAADGPSGAAEAPALPQPENGQLSDPASFVHRSLSQLPPHVSLAQGRSQPGVLVPADRPVARFQSDRPRGGLHGMNGLVANIPSGPQVRPTGPGAGHPPGRGSARWGPGPVVPVSAQAPGQPSNPPPFVPHPVQQPMPWHSAQSGRPMGVAMPHQGGPLGVAMSHQGALLGGAMPQHVEMHAMRRSLPGMPRNGPPAVAPMHQALQPRHFPVPPPREQQYP